MNWTRNPFNWTFNPCFTRDAYLIFMYKICKIKKELDKNDEQGSFNLFRSMSRRLKKWNDSRGLSLFGGMNF